jgi:hypothetical protein
METVIILSEEEKKEFIELTKPLYNISPFKEMNLYLSLAKYASEKIPTRIKKLLDEFKKKTSKSDILLFKNIPYDENIVTPENNQSHIGENTILSKIQAIINEYIGEMVGYESEGYGRLFQDMVPNKNLSVTQTSLGSKVELELHTEQAFSELRPDFLSLACLKGDFFAKTYYFHINQIVKQMTNEEMNYLKQNKWMIGIDESFVMNGCSNELRGPLSIITEHNNYYQLVFDQDLMIGITEEATQLLTKIIDLYYLYRKEVILNPGEILILNNKKLVHGRSSFSPKFDGNDRFIVRSFIMNHINRINNKTIDNKRIISAKYS